MKAIGNIMNGTHGGLGQNTRGFHGHIFGGGGDHTHWTLTD